MNMIQTQVSKLTANPIGAIAGGVLVFWATKKYAGVSNNWMLGLAAVVGAVGGAMAQGSMKKPAMVTAPSVK